MSTDRVIESVCDWRAGNEGEFVSLEFTSMLTECSYDYVFVYDGHTYDSPLLGSFSGSTMPDVLIATAQYVSTLHTSHSLGEVNFHQV